MIFLICFLILLIIAGRVDNGGDDFDEYGY